MPRPTLVKVGPKKPRKQSAHLKLRSISLVDAKGKPRIYMDAGSGGGYANISLYGDDGHLIQIATEPGGGSSICLFAKGGKVAASFGISSQNNSGLILPDQEGRPGTMIGSVDPEGSHSIILFKNGQVEWAAGKGLRLSTNEVD